MTRLRPSRWSGRPPRSLLGSPGRRPGRAPGWATLPVMTAKLPGDDCQRDWIWDREVETAGPDATFAMAAVAWDRQLGHLLEDSPLAARKLRQAGVGPKGIDLADIAKLPFSTKEELKAAIDEAPPFGT